MLDQTPPEIWRPTQKFYETTNLARYEKWLEKKWSLRFSDYFEMQKWSADAPEMFWRTQAEFHKIIWQKPYKKVLVGSKMPDFEWFTESKLNYAEHIFRMKTTARPALIFQKEGGEIEETSWADLEKMTRRLQAFFIENGIEKGDRVVGFLPNSPQAVAACLATISMGAVWSCCSPDFGASSVADRFQQIEPKILVAVDGYSYGGKLFDKTMVVEELLQLLPSVEQVVFIPYLNVKATLAKPSLKVEYWSSIVEKSSLKDEKVLFFEAVEFAHPLWILYSSGTTGIPKAIVHGHGGNLLEHLKYLSLHNDVRVGERFFWFATTGWMMWNFTVASLLVGATAVLFDGSPGFPTLDFLWEFAEKAEIEHFGTSAPFLVACRKSGKEPGRKFGLKKLRTIGSTGSPLPAEAFDWVFEKVKNPLWLSSMAGGTDVCTAWVGGVPSLPVFQGEIQAVCLGCQMESWDENGQKLEVGEVGEMVITKPMPSMPVAFWNDPMGEKYRASYFEHFENVWRHGDWIRFNERGGLQILGRSDATLNRQGVRIGTAEIYRALDQIAEIEDALILNLEKNDGSDWMPLFIKMARNEPFSPILVEKIKKTLRWECSPRHVPDAIFECPDVPLTISGKKMESPVKQIFQQKPLEKAFNRDSMRNPEAMDFFIAFSKKLPF